MNLASSSIGFLVFGFLAASVSDAAEPTPPGPLVLVVQTGLNPRKDTPVRVEVPGDRLGEPLRAALADGPRPVHLRELRDRVAGRRADRRRRRSGCRMPRRGGSD